MTNWVKKIIFSGVIIIIVSAIQYVNDIYLHNLILYLLNYAYLVGLLILTIGFLWNEDSEKIISDDDTVMINRIRDKIDSKIMSEQIDMKDFFKKQYISNEIDNL